MSNIYLVLQLILSLSILVVLHEFGHYLPAKWFKTRVEKFYLFFNPYFSLFKKQIGETEWGIGWIPFGGYVKIAGMIDESMDKEQMKLPPQPYEFRSKKAWQRLIIMIGGVTVNFILGILIFAGMLVYWGESYIKTSDAKYGIKVEELGKTLGLMDGDIITHVDTFQVEKFNSGIVSKHIIFDEAKTVTVRRDDKEIILQVPVDLVSELTKYDNKGKTLFSLRYPASIAQIDTTGMAFKAGIETPVQITKINNTDVTYVNDFMQEVYTNKGKIVQVQVVSEEGMASLQYVGISLAGKMGVMLEPVDKFIPFSTQKFGVFGSLKKGSQMAVGFLGDQLKAFGQMFSGKIKAKESLGSIVSIATMFDKSWDWRVFWQITASLSILLAFFNLLPIPALDGGYVVFLIWETITGKAPSDKFMEVVNYVGFILLLSLMVFALGLDFMRFFK